MIVEREIILEVAALQKRYANGTLAIQEITLDVRKSEFASIVGPSGAGKTTLLKTICALLAPTAGQVMLHGKPIVEPPPEMILVFQDYARSLFPWLTVMGNVIFPLKKRSDISKSEKENLCKEAIKAVGLERFSNYYPWQLSGGMQQRVALARAIAFRPEMLLVTHDIDEAVYLSDRVFVLSPPPSVLVAEIPIPLAQPRDQIRTRSDQKFLELRNRIHKMIGKPKEQVLAEDEEHALATAALELNKTPS